MRRREFVAGLMLPLLARAAWAQQPAKIHRIAVIDPTRAIADISESNPDYRVFFQELRALGYIEGGNLIIERRSGESRPERYAALAQEAVALHPDVIVSNGTALAAHLKAATKTIPIVTNVGDPVAFGLIASMARPGGNITGFSIDGGIEAYGKALEILRSINTSMTKAALLAHRSQWEGRYARELLDVAQRLKIEMVRLPPDGFDESEYRRVIGAFVENGVGGVIVPPMAEFWTSRHVFVDLLNRARLVAIYPYDDYARIGGLIAYSPDLEQMVRLSVRYVDRILNGANPAEMPFLQPTKFLTVINLKTARALGVEMPPSLL